MDTPDDTDPEAVYRRILEETPALVLNNADLASLVLLSTASVRPVVASRAPRLRDRTPQPGAEVAALLAAALAAGEEQAAEAQPADEEESDAASDSSSESSTSDESS